MWYWKVWFDLIWFDLIRHSKSHWKQHSLRKIFILVHCWFASNKYFSISFSFSRFRCFCSRKCHSRNAKRMGRLEKTAFLSLAEKEEENWSSTCLFILKRVFIHFYFSLFNKQTRSFSLVEHHQPYFQNFGLSLIFYTSI